MTSCRCQRESEVGRQMIFVSALLEFITGVVKIAFEFSITALKVTIELVNAVNGTILSLATLLEKSSALLKVIFDFSLNAMTMLCNFTFGFCNGMCLIFAKIRERRSPRYDDDRSSNF